MPQQGFGQQRAALPNKLRRYARMHTCNPWPVLGHMAQTHASRLTNFICWAFSIGYRPRWWSDIWRTDRGVAEVRSPGIRPATEDDIRHNAPGLLETVHRLLRIKVRRKLLNQDKTSRLASYALQQHEPKSAASEFSFLLAVLRLL